MPDFLAGTRSWEESKRVGPVMLKVVLTNKSTDKDLKVWYRLATKSDPTAEAVAGRRLNLGLRHSMRKYYLARKNQRTAETFVKVDPTKNYFFESIDDIRVELEIVVRNTSGGGVQSTLGSGARRVQYAPGTLGVGPLEVATSNLYDVGRDFDRGSDDERDDVDQYEHYESGHYPGAGASGLQAEQQLGALLLHESGNDADNEERQSNDSTSAVAHMDEDDQANVDRELRGSDGNDCGECGAEGQADAFNCESCGAYQGGI